MTQRITDLTLSVLAGVLAFLLSWPFWRNFEYWAEGPVAWWIYFVVGFGLAVYVFIGSLHILFLHDTQAVVTPTTTSPDSTADKGERS